MNYLSQGSGWKELFLHRNILSLGAMAWVACGKDAGFTPQFLLEEAQRLAHYHAA